MDYFNYKNDILHAEDVNLFELAKKVGTPFYCYSQNTLEHHAKLFHNALKGTDYEVCFALKANSNTSVLKVLANKNIGADVVSKGELQKALDSGIKPRKIVFSGVGKTKEELLFALEKDILQINVESKEELESLNKIAKNVGKKAPIAFRVNPDVDAKTHKKISTGKKENKFGINIEKAIEIYEHASKLEGIKVVGIDVHIGSQLLDLEPFRKAFKKIKELVIKLEDKKIPIAHIDLGGGLGIPYDKEKQKGKTPNPQQYANLIKEIFGDMNKKIIIEPGRLIAGNSGILVSKVTYLKKGDNKNFLILDAAMNDLVRPALYDAYHGFRPVIKKQEHKEKILADIVGPICETSDTFAMNRKIEKLEEDELVSIESSGAYGAVMSSFYNLRAMAPEIMVKDDKYAIIRKRISIKDMEQFEQEPDWLS